MLLQLILLTAAVALAAPSPVELAPRAASTHYLFSFGDSYTATGFDITGTLPSCDNQIGNPAFPGNTVGPWNWIDEMVQLAPACFLAWNFAVGSALINGTLIQPTNPTVSTLISQVAGFSSIIGTSPHPSTYPWTPSNAAAAIWLGINDVGNSWYWGNSSTINTLDLTDYFDQLNILYTAGVRKFLILTVPPTDRTPYWMGWGASSDAAVGTDVQAFNTLLVSDARSWAKSKKGVNLKVLDTVPIFNYILDNPEQYGAPNATCYNDDGTDCLWANNYHPGIAIQTAVGVAAYGKVFGSGSLGLR